MLDLFWRMAVECGVAFISIISCFFNFFYRLWIYDYSFFFLSSTSCMMDLEFMAPPGLLFIFLNYPTLYRKYKTTINIIRPSKTSYHLICPLSLCGFLFVYCFAIHVCYLDSSWSRRARLLYSSWRLFCLASYDFRFRSIRLKKGSLKVLGFEGSFQNFCQFFSTISSLFSFPKHFLRLVICCSLSSQLLTSSALNSIRGVFPVARQIQFTSFLNLLNFDHMPLTLTISIHCSSNCRNCFCFSFSCHRPIWSQLISFSLPILIACNSWTLFSYSSRIWACYYSCYSQICFCRSCWLRFQWTKVMLVIRA